MNQFLLKARRNLDFLKMLENEFPHEYFEWKVTIIFYIALNATKGYLDKSGLPPKSNHQDLQKQIEALSNNTSSCVFDTMYPTEYNRIRNYSESSRYDPIQNNELYDDIFRGNYNQCKIKLNRIIDFLNSKNCSF